MKKVQQAVHDFVRGNYENIVGEDVEAWPGVFLPHLLCEFIHRDSETLQLSFHIGYAEGREDCVEQIHDNLRRYLDSQDFGAVLYDAGEGVLQKVAVNKEENQFLQQQVHFVLKKE